MKNWFEKSRLGWLLMAVGIIAACAPKEKPRELTLDEKIASETILPQDPNPERRQFIGFGVSAALLRQLEHTGNDYDHSL